MQNVQSFILVASCMLSGTCAVEPWGVQVVFFADFSRINTVNLLDGVEGISVLVPEFSLPVSRLKIASL